MTVATFRENQDGQIIICLNKGIMGEDSKFITKFFSENPDILSNSTFQHIGFEDQFTVAKSVPLERAVQELMAVFTTHSKIAPIAFHDYHWSLLFGYDDITKIK